jgi:trk system potassium uptake protein TrkH
VRKTLRSLNGFLISLHPVRLVLLGYVSYIIIGWVLLSLPFAQRRPVAALDGLFVTTSAISTTGLTTVSVSDSYTLVWAT